VASWFPYPSDNGIRQRIAAVIAALDARFAVDLVTLVDEPVAAPAVAMARERCERVRVVVRRPFLRTGMRSLAAFLHPLPRSVVVTNTREMCHAIDGLVSERGYDAVVVVEVHVARYAMHLRNVTRVIDDLELSSLRANQPTASGLRRARSALAWRKISRYVRTLLRNFDLITAVSEHDRADALAIEPHANVLVVPNAIDIPGTPMALAAPVPGTMVYAGSPTFQLNREAVQWFAGDVLARVCEQVPDCVLRVTGRTEPVATELPRGPHIEYTGHLDDVRPTIAGASVSVVPLQRGGGTRLKVLESLALGTPVVSTTKGIEGLDLVPGKEVLVADDADDFAAAVVEVLTKPDRRAELVRAGRRAVEDRYDWRPITQRFVDEVERLVESRVRSAR
jgi:glycosyltransferase involved in cell wall biosynthesis